MQENAKRQDRIVLDFDKISDRMTIIYTSMNRPTLFDICDENGKILQTGRIDGDRVEVDTALLERARYILLILDGDMIRIQPFELAA